MRAKDELYKDFVRTRASVKWGLGDSWKVFAISFPVNIMDDAHLDKINQK